MSNAMALEVIVEQYHDAISAATNAVNQLKLAIRQEHAARLKAEKERDELKPKPEAEKPKQK